MQKTIIVNDRLVWVEISAAAARAVAARVARKGEALSVEMELLFSCLIRKQVRFLEQAPAGDVPIVPGLSAHFRPVMTRVCSVSEGGTAPPLTDFPIANARAYVPHWLNIDYRRGAWRGEFGYR